MNQGRFSKVVSVLVTGIIAMSGLPCKVLADVISAPTYYSVQSELDYEITTNITSSWINHESIDLVLTNTGSDTIHNWYLTFNTPYNIENIWNGTIYETDGNGTYTITSNGWNQDIHTGESVTVGITFSSDTETELSINPEWYLLNTQATVVEASQYTLAYTEYSAWETGFTGQLTLTPQVDCQHWELSFASNREITAVSSAVLIPEGDNNYAITHDENNMRLIASNAYNFGIQGDNTEDPLEFSTVELTVVDLAYHLTDDEDANGIPDYLEFIGGSIVVEPTPTPVPTVMPTEEPITTPTNEPSDTPAPTEEPTPTEAEDPYYGLRDYDADGLLDYQEEIYGTDIYYPDTDGDGLQDGDEIDILTNPKVADTDGNGIRDFEEDYDGDGICNGGEYTTGTCMFAYDSDYDGINDYNEVYFYGIDPRNEDSDSDGIKDGDEVTLGLNPGSSDSDGDGITDDYVMFSQSLSMDPIAEDHPHEITGVSISGNISGLITSNTTIEDTYNRDIYCTDVYGRVGVPINIESEGHFDSMTLTINYDEGALGDTNEANLGVLWYDENTGFFITQEQAVVDTTNNTITLELSHFSTYVVVDLEMWNNPIIPDYSNYIQIASESDEYWEWGGSVPTLEDREVGCFNWWKLSHPLQLFQIVETLSSNRYCENPNSYVRFWHYEYTWLVMDMTDSDEDGVLDFIESQGILGTNGHIYYANPTKNDSDDDTLPDKDEIGVIYELSRSMDGRSITIRIGNDVVFTNDFGIIPSDSEYSFLNDYFDSIPNGGRVMVCVPKSDARIPDSDEDGYSDSEDARPVFVNDDVTYVLSNPDHLDSANLRIMRYREAGLEVIALKFQDANSFENAWEGIGLYEEFYINGEKLYGDKYYYNAQNVVICTHGAPYGFSLGEGNASLNSPYMMYVSKYIATDSSLPSIDDLTDKRIESLNLYACSCGRSINDGYNVAEEFLNSVMGINQVIAPDVDLYRFDAVNTFQGYLSSEIDYCTDAEYEDYCNSVVDSNSNGLYFYNYYEVYENPCGFIVFSDDGEIDLYSDDVIYGVLHTTIDNYNNRRGGVLDYSPDYASHVNMNNWHDPVID